MNPEALVTPILVFLCFGLTVWLIKRNLSDFKGSLQRMEQAHTECRVMLAREYAPRTDVKDLWERVDEHTKDIAEIKGNLGMK